MTLGEPFGVQTVAGWIGVTARRDADGGYETELLQRPLFYRDVIEKATRKNLTKMRVESIDLMK